MTLHELADELLEIRRYVRSHPEHVKRQIARPVVHSNAASTAFCGRFQQLVANINTGLARIVVDPEILEGYLYGAAAEIREMAIERENAG